MVVFSLGLDKNIIEKMNPLISLDAHAHINPVRQPDELLDSGAVLAMTLSLKEASTAINRSDPWIAWGVGCHPRFPRSQLDFNADLFRSYVERSAIVGEIGLDGGSQVPLDIQQRNFRQVLDVLTDFSRIISIHSYRATGLIMAELRRRPIKIPILHWWTGSVQETREAVSLGCYFSVHSAVARNSKFRTSVPAERILIESDHGYSDPPEAIPYRIKWVEYLVAQQLKVDVLEIRQITWRNFAVIVNQTGTIGLLPKSMAEILAELV
jgi:TatD DNase family protein